MKTLVTETLDFHINIIWHEHSIFSWLHLCLFSGFVTALYHFSSHINIKCLVNVVAWCMNTEHVLVLFLFVYFLDACQMNWQKWAFSYSYGGSCVAWFPAPKILGAGAGGILRALTWAFFIHVRLEIYA